MKPPEAREQHRRQENAKKAKEAADELFPGEKWIPVEGEEHIYLSPRRPVGEKSNYKEELRDAGSTVYLAPEKRSDPGKKYDAIVDGQKFEFKNIRGKENALIHQFLRSRLQAPNVFINLEASNLARREIMAALYGARNSPVYGDYCGFSGGKIVLKIKGQTSLIYLNVDDLQV
ncbi:MAG: hypothetical protein LBK61_05225 [Spirochaetaceae bacterium]|nr:hypothetical protein [Spirochaetaceae bacterium]